MFLNRETCTWIVAKNRIAKYYLKTVIVCWNPATGNAPF